MAEEEEKEEEEEPTVHSPQFMCAELQMPSLVTPALIRGAAVLNATN